MTDTPSNDPRGPETRGASAEQPASSQRAAGQPDVEQPDLGPIHRFKEKILAEYDRLSLEDTFQFGCHPGVPCFNQCCADVNIFLTPYDVLRMKSALKMDSSEFLERYTQIPIQKHQLYPVVMLKMDHARESKPCQLVTDEGCSVYEDRPWPCRMYPLGMASPRDEEANDFYFVMKEDVCQGFSEQKQWTVQEWLDDQGMEPYDEFGRLYKDITLHDRFRQGRKLTPERMEIFYMACYDLDSFRRFVFESTFLKRFQVDEDVLERLREDDEELLRFAFRWLKFALFGEPTIDIKPEAMPPSSATANRG